MAIKDIGYEQEASTGRRPTSRCCCTPQSADIAQGVDSRRQQGRRRRRPGHHVRLRLPRDARADAGADLLRHKILRADLPRPASRARRGRMLGPDAKSQVTVRYENGKPVGVDADRASRTQHLDEILTSATGARARRALRPQGAARGLDHARRPSGTSIRPASSSSAARTATAA